MLRQWRLINDGPGDPAWNMAVDEALLRLHDERSLPVLRLYTWDPSALSLGYFQKTSGIRFDELRRLHIIPVRRISGGRAVLHFGDLTYSITISGAGGIPFGTSAAYRYLCGGLLTAFTALGVDAALGSERSGRHAPEACFALSTHADIIFKGKKFVGSAQKRIGASLLQHGSILLRPQEAILARIFENGQTRDKGTLSEKITCLEHIVERPVEPDEVADAVAAGFAAAINVEFLPDRLTMDEVLAARSLVYKYQANHK